MKFMNNKDLYIIRENSGFVVSELVIGSGEQDINFEVQSHWLYRSFYTRKMRAQYSNHF